MSCLCAFGFFVAILVAVSGAPAWAESSSNGVYGGYVGSDAANKFDYEAARRRAVLEHNLKPGSEERGGSGIEVDLQIVFPAGQRGVANLNTITLQPEDSGAHSAMALASANGDSNTLTSSFVPKKGVIGGHIYKVLVGDSMGDSYAVARIRVQENRSPQNFRISAPLLTASASRHGATGSAANPSAGFTPPPVGPGYRPPQIGPGFVHPGTN